MAPNHERNLIRVEVQGHIEEIVIVTYFDYKSNS